MMKKLLLALYLLQISLGQHVDKTWWKYTTLYEVFLPSFKDGNGDGMGDLKGLISKLDHFVELGIETVYITPHYESPMVDSGYDITNFTAMNPMMGSMEDFEKLIEEMNSRGLKLVIDLVINHSSDEHPWFIKSINKEEPYADFYIWKDPIGYNEKGIPIPPNNWRSVFDGSAWQWNDRRKQFYFAQFTAKQPDFNFHNKRMRTEIKKIFKFWLDKGVGGFRLDAVRYLMEDEQFLDEPLASPDILEPRKFRDLKHIYTQNLRSTYQLLHELRSFFDKVCNKFNDFERIFVTEDYVDGELLYKYYGSEKYKISHLPLNFIFDYVNGYENASFYHNSINNYLSGLPEDATPSWNAENHDKFRISFILNEEFEFIFASLVMMLPGLAYLYYGQEIGVTGSKIRPQQEVNNFFDDLTQTSRDYFRHPMPWDDSLNAGFSTNHETYIPLNPNYWRINVKAQKNEAQSYYQMFKKMAKLRKTDTLKYGDFKSYVVSNWVFAFSRTLKGRRSYVVVMNFGSETEFIDIYNHIDNLPEFMTVEVASPNSGFVIGDEIPTVQEIPKMLMLRPLATVVLSTTPSRTRHLK